MNRRVVVTGLGVISGLGNSSIALHQALCEGRCGFELCTDLLPGGVARYAGRLSSFQPRDHLQGGNLRLLDRTAQLVASATDQALAASGWTSEMRRANEVGLVLGTMFGSLQTTSAFDRRARLAGGIYAKPMDFANSVIHAPAAQTAIWHRLRGVNAAVAGGPAAGLAAVIYAADLIGSGQADQVLAVGADELSCEAFLGLERANLLSPGGGEDGDLPGPFDVRRNGFIAAEGAACLMLETEESARARGAVIIAELLGHGSSFDVTGGGEEQRAIEATHRAVRQAMNQAGVGADDLDAWSAGANGSLMGDRCEARAIVEVLGANVDHVAVTAIKSMLGETLGASGVFQVVDMIESMHTGLLPGIRGLENPEEDFPVGRAASRTRKVSISVGLIQAASLDGIHCSLLIKRRG